MNNIIIPYRKNDKWGFSNHKKEVVIDCVFDDVEPFNEGLAVVIRNGTLEFINQNGETVINSANQYYPHHAGSSFHEGISAVRSIDNKTGFINKSGEVIIGFDYSNATHFHEGLCVVSFYDKKQNEHKYGCINKRNEEVIPLQFYEVAKYFSEGFLSIKMDVDGEFKWGFVNIHNQNVIDCVYDNSSNRRDYAESYFHEGVATVYKDYRYGGIDFNGKIIIPFLYQDLGDFSNGVTNALSSDSMLYGYIDMQGKTFIPFKYKFASSFKDGLAKVVDNKTQKVGFINMADELVIPFNYDRASDFENGLARVDSKGYINSEGTQFWE